jgi:hypothetical protein
MFDPLCKLRPRPGSPPSSNGRGLFLWGVRGLRRQFLATAPQIAPLPGNGSDEQMFGAEQQVPHRGRSDQEAEPPMDSAMMLQQAKSIARHLGLTLRQVRSGDYRVNFRDGNETTAYYTDNLEDAVNAVVEMARNRDA